MKLSKEELIRYTRQLSLKEFGMEGQMKLKQSGVLVVGAGGLGCPALLYLVAAGVGKIGVMDFDTVENHNLPRQILFTESDIGKAKTEAAIGQLQKRNSFVEFKSHDERLTKENALKIFPSYDIILDCTDNFSARYAINDACVLLDKPFVYGSIFKYEGQVALFNAKVDDENGPTYRCLFPDPPAPGTIPDCEETGVIGFLPGLIGTMQAGEAIKWITGKKTLSGKLLSVDTREMKFELFEVARNESLWRNTFSEAKAAHTL